MRRINLAGLGFVMAAVLAVPAAYAGQQQTGTYTPQAEGRGHRGSGGPGFGGAMGMRGGAWSQLDLTDAQKGQLKQIRANHRDAIVQLSTQLGTMRQQLHEAENGATFDEDVATRQLTAMASIEAKLMGERFKERQESEAILTADQKVKLQQIQEQMKANWASRRAGQGAVSK